MSEQLKFNEFNIAQHDVYEVGGGVIPEMAVAFDYQLDKAANEDNLGGLIGAVGPAKELQENIERVREVLGTDKDAVAIAQNWVTRTGLLDEVARPYMEAEELREERFSVAIITGGVRNWMVRRAQRLEQELDRVNKVVLVGGNREMKSTEGADVEEGMTEADYLESVVQQMIQATGVEVNTEHVNSSIGNDVMRSASKHVHANDRVLIASNAGAWLQNAGQLRRAVRDYRSHSFDENHDQFFVVSDGFELGDGTQPTATHQNPYTALGQIARNAQEIVRHQQQGSAGIYTAQ